MFQIDRLIIKLYNIVTKIGKERCECKVNDELNNYDVVIKKVIWAYKQDIYSPWECNYYQDSEEENLYELMYISRGSFICLKDGENTAYKAGEIILRLEKSGGTPYKNISRELPFTYHSIIFSTENPIELRGKCDPYYSIVSKYGNDPEAQFLKAFEMFIEKPPYYNLGLRSIVNEVLREFLTADLKAEERKIFPKYVRQCLERLRTEAFFSETEIGSLAGDYNISAAHFIREFKKYVGMSPKQYILKMKLSRSRELIRHTNLPISEISEKCGFENVTYFNRIFKARYEETPTAFRRKSR